MLAAPATRQKPLDIANSHINIRNNLPTALSIEVFIALFWTLADGCVSSRIVSCTNNLFIYPQYSGTALAGAHGPEAQIVGTPEQVYPGPAAVSLRQH